jgi:hypothetical protein
MAVTSFVDGCVFTAASAGTGSFVVSAALLGWLTPAQASAVNGATYRYRAYSTDLTQWEIGTGVYTSGTVTLTRAVVEFSSNANAAVNFTLAPLVALTVFSADLLTAGMGAGTSGGVPYFSSTALLSSSALLAANALVLGGGAGAAPKTAAGVITDGTSVLTLGVAGGAVGGLVFNNATSGTITLNPVTGALGSAVLSLPAATDTLIGKATTDTLTNKTLTTPVLTGLPTGTGVAAAATASTLASRDSNANLTANAIWSSATSVATAAGTTTLTVASSGTQVFTGVTTQTAVLPVTSTLVLGQFYEIVNNSSGVVTVQSSGANTLLAMAANTLATFTVALATGTGAASWWVLAGDTKLSKANNLSDLAGPLATAQKNLGVREVLTGARTYYVRTDGSDSNTGLVNSAGGGFLTIQKALNVAAALDFNGQTVTIQVADGTYIGANFVPVTVGQTYTPSLVIQGNAGTPGNVIISTTNADAFASVAGGRALVKDMELRTTTAGYSLHADGVGSELQWSNLRFGACAADHVLATSGALATCAGNYSIVGSASRHWNTDRGIIEVANRTITITGTPAFAGAFANASQGHIRAFSNTYTGAATGVRYNVAMNGTIQTFGAGASALPGNSAGTTATGGQYA